MVGAAVLTVSTATGCADGGDVSVPASWRVVAAPDAGDRDLRIEVLGGGCGADEEQLGELDVVETSTRVGIIAHLVTPADAATDCPAIGTVHPAVVRLEAPLGDRELTGCDLGRAPGRPTACRGPG